MGKATRRSQSGGRGRATKGAGRRWYCSSLAERSARLVGCGSLGIDQVVLCVRVIAECVEVFDQGDFFLLEGRVDTHHDLDGRDSLQAVEIEEVDDQVGFFVEARGDGEGGGDLQLGAVETGVVAGVLDEDADFGLVPREPGRVDGFFDDGGYGCEGLFGELDWGRWADESQVTTHNASSGTVGEWVEFRGTTYQLGCFGGGIARCRARESV